VDSIWLRALHYGITSPSPTPNAQHSTTIKRPQARAKVEVKPSNSSFPLIETSYSTKQLQVLENTEDGTLFQLTPTKSIDWESVRIGDQFTWNIGKGYRIGGIVDSLNHTDQSISFGVTLDLPRGRVALKKKHSPSCSHLFEQTAHCTPSRK
jgi:hypothetical protein|tara:strand:- start:6896 stop:7351 length:456 start_codon:yes stop_codon:yes gene_type:complete